MFLHNYDAVDIHHSGFSGIYLGAVRFAQTFVTVCLNLCYSIYTDLYYVCAIICCDNFKGPELSGKRACVTYRSKEPISHYPEWPHCLYYLYERLNSAQVTLLYVDKPRLITGYKYCVPHFGALTW